MNIFKKVISFIKRTLLRKDNKCPFCNKKILKKQIVYSGEKVSALYNLTPISLGNILVIPQRHITRFEELLPEESSEIQFVIKKVVEAFKNIYKIDNYLILQKNGKQAGQNIAHIHFHVIPCPIDVSYIIDSAFHYRSAISDDEMQKRTIELQHFFLKNP